MLNIKRERWAIVCGGYKINHLPENYYEAEPAEGEIKIFCGLARHYELVPIDNIGDKAIKTYLSKKKAESAFKSSWRYGEGLIDAEIAKAVKVIESIAEVAEC